MAILFFSLRKCRRVKGIVILMILTPACETNPFTGCENDYYFDRDNSLSFRILDHSTKAEILKIGVTTYNYDTVRIINEDGEKVYPIGKWDAFDGVISLIFIDNVDKGVVNTKISRRLFMYFNHADVDTLDFDFEMRNDKCDHQVMKYFKVSYNDSVYFDRETDDVPNLVFLK